MSAAPRPIQRSLDRLTCLIFAGLLLAPLADELFRSADARGPMVHELRRPALPPRLEPELASLTRYAEGFESWYMDRFGLRDVLLRGRSRLYYCGLGLSPRLNVEVGVDDWGFFTDSPGLSVHRGLRPMSAATLENWQRFLEHQHELLASRGIEYLVVFAPAKQTVYPERVPARFNRVGPNRLEQLLAHLAAHSKVPVLDLRAALAEERALDQGEDTAYARLGAHWVRRGAYRAYCEIIRRLSARFPALVPLGPEAVVLGPADQDSWMQTAYLADLEPQHNEVFVPAAPRAQPGAQREWWRLHSVRSEVADPALPKALLMHDSFGTYVDDLLAEHFQRLAISRQEFDLTSIESQPPDVVIALYVERILDLEPPLAIPLASEVARRFEVAKRSLLVLDLADAGAAVGRGGNVELDVQQTASGPALAIQIRNPGDHVVLPAYAVPPDGRALVALEFESPVESSAALWLRERNELQFERDVRIRRDVAPGANRLVIEVSDPGTDGRVRFRPGLVPGSYLLTRFEVRAP